MILAYKLTESDSKGLTVSVFLDGRNYTYTPDSHTAFYELLDSLRAYGNALNSGSGDLTALQDEVVKLLRPEYLTRIAETTKKIEIHDGNVYYGDEALHGVLVERIVRFYEKGLPYEYLFKFLENLMSNPDKRSKEQLYSFLERYDFPITPDGYFLAYKGLLSDYTSVHAGYGIVDGSVIEHGHLPNNVGSVVTMPRHKVNANPNEGCSYGLHIGSLQYARDFAQGKVVIVKVNPRDVVSVPVDCSYQKVRCCKYEVISEFTEEIKDDIVETSSDNLRDLIQDMVDDTISNEFHLANRAIKMLHPDASGLERKNYFDEYVKVSREILGFDAEDEEQDERDEFLEDVIQLVWDNTDSIFPAQNVWHLANRILNLEFGRGGWTMADEEYEEYLDAAKKIYDVAEQDYNDEITLEEWNRKFSR